ncbi:RNA polymerase sigma-70 factor, ECF subfamily [Paenibacillaceae bacterium GAS479]|nr:RNA polymerase sigma-70 factor, ECF subfamily [Paenibacillaceae bacterium GAS479]
MDTATKLEEERGALRRYCLSLAGSPCDAEDLEQSAWCRALAYPGWDGHANKQALLLRIARNLWTDQQRRNALHQRVLPELLPDQAAAYIPQQHTDSWELETMLHSLERRMTPLQLAVWLLREMHGSSIAETAERLCMTEGAVKAAMYRSRRALAAVRRDLQAGGLRETADEALLVRVRGLAAALRTGDAAAIAALAEQDALEPAVAAAILAGRVQASAGAVPDAGAADSPHACADYDAAAWTASRAVVSGVGYTTAVGTAFPSAFSGYASTTMSGWKGVGGLRAVG